MTNLAYYAGTLLFIGALTLLIGRLTHLSWTAIAALTLVISTYLIITNPAPAQDTGGPLPAQLEKIRARYDVPALGAALFTTDGLQEIAVTGTRKRGDPTPVTEADLWHLGSDTKVMTAMLLGTYVAEGKLHWDDKVAAFFPDLADQIPAANRDITLAQVLSHQAGLAENLDWFALAGSGDSLMLQRQSAVRLALTQPKYPPGAFHYANTDYVLIGAILEKIGGQSWEDLIRRRIFQPLGLASAGFGPPGTPGQVDQPWPHDDKGNPVALASGAAWNGNPPADNPPCMGPAGTVHMTIADWAKFLTDQLRGARGEKALLPGDIYAAIDAPRIADNPRMQYGFGWGIVTRPWAGGTAFTHAGSNTLNYCVAWLAPKNGFGVLVTCNQGGDTAAGKACDEAASLLIQRHGKM